jgi:hypothetical protein
MGDIAIIMNLYYNYWNDHRRVGSLLQETSQLRPQNEASQRELKGLKEQLQSSDLSQKARVISIRREG